MELKKSRKRNNKNSKEFMPLSKGKLFDSDNEEDCQYNWGFKKSVRSNEQEEPVKAKRPKFDDQPENVSKKLIYAKNVKPYEIKKAEDHEMYMENLAKVYNRSYVYIPSFINVEDISENTDMLIEASIKHMFEEEVKLLEDILNNFWIPLNESYVETNRLSNKCSAYQMIVKCLNQCNETKKVYENCIDNFNENAAKFRDVLNNWASKDVDSISKIFRDSVGNILLKYKDYPDVSFEKMANESNKSIFNRMVIDEIAVVKSRVVKARKEKEIESESEKSEEKEDETEASAADRPVSKRIMDNKGLVPRRKKADANPRVKHRMKFKKAIVKYHSNVPRNRDDTGNYEGEQSGIRIGVIKSNKIK